MLTKLCQHCSGYDTRQKTAPQKLKYICIGLVWAVRLCAKLPLTLWRLYMISKTMQADTGEGLEHS